LAVNSALIHFYWELGKQISEKENVWGGKLIASVSKDLIAEFPDMKGFSVRNLKYCRTFYTFYNNQIGQQAVAQLQIPNNHKDGKLQQLVAQLPWGHNILIFTKAKDIQEALFYIQKTRENNWSRNILDHQVSSKLYERQGKAISNFKTTLPAPLSDLAIETLKDPYVFDFLTLGERYRDQDIEKQLIQHISKFLLELGKGFAFIGNQYLLNIADQDYYLDLLFYHTKLKCYVVIELKNTRFIPEVAGKLNFYLSAVDGLIKDESDNPTIGILLCKDKNNIEAEFALRDMNKPMGVSELRLVQSLPEDLQSSLPTIAEIEKEFRDME
jgi:predicted nuclease of restriction endonuclease-like (RecB) superfamily